MKKEDRNNFVYTRHVLSRMAERNITKEEVKSVIRNPEHEEQDGGSTRSFKTKEIISGKIKNQIVVIWTQNSKKQIIIKTTFYKNIKFK